MSSGVLPPGPDGGVLAQTVRLHRDPLGTLRRARSEFGDVFTMRLATARPIVVVAAADEVEALLQADPGSAHAGEARRRILPMASPRSIFGSDGDQHGAARSRVADVFRPDAIDAHRAAMAAIAARHVASWPRNRPVRALVRMRALIDEVFVRLLLGVDDADRGAAVTTALRRMLWTPGNPPLTIPGEGDGLMGAAGTALFKRRQAPLKQLLAEEIDARRRSGPTRADVIGCMVADEAGLPTDAIADELIALLMAAQEPPAAAVTWLLDRLARDQGLAERFIADDAGGFRGAVVCETLRLRPPAMAALRRLTAPRTLAGHALPAGITVMLPTPLLHRDEHAFPDPDDFRAERWMSGKAHEATYLPFGGGARRCVGEPLARTYIDSLLPTILQRVRLRPAWPREEKMVLRGTILVPHRSGAIVARTR